MDPKPRSWHRFCSMKLCGWWWGRPLHQRSWLEMEVALCHEAPPLAAEEEPLMPHHDLLCDMMMLMVVVPSTLLLLDTDSSFLKEKKTEQTSMGSDYGFDISIQFGLLMSNADASD